ncbi:MAG TPA: ATP-binding protein, partial [Vicinamibacterales bacterium]
MAAIQDELRFQMAVPLNQLGSLAQWLSVSPTATTADLRELAQGLRGVSSLEWAPGGPEGATGQGPMPKAQGPNVGGQEGGTGRGSRPNAQGPGVERLPEGPDVQLQDIPDLEPTLARARDTGAAAASPPFGVEARADVVGVAVAMPVYAHVEAATAPAGVDDRRARLRGHAVGVVLVDSMANELAREASTLGLSLRLSDVTRVERPVPLLAQGTPATGGASLRVSQPAVFGGRTWLLEMAPVRPDLLPGETPEGRLLLVSATVLMFLTGLFVVTEAGLGVAVAAEVTHRTAELSSEVVVRRRLEAVARENEARLDLALRGSRLALWDLEVASGRVFMSDDWADMLEQDRGSNVVDIAVLESLVHPDDVERVRAAAYAALKGLTPDYSVEHRVRTAAGDWKWIHSHGMVTERSAQGRALRMTGTNADIDVRKRSEDAVASAERRLREVTDGLPGAVYQLQWPAGSTMPRLNFLSAGITELMGLTRDAVVEDPSLFFGALVPDDRDGVLASLRGANEGAAAHWSADFCIERPDGRIVWARSQASRVGTDAGAVWNGYLVDISPLVRVEQDLRDARDQAERANRAKSAFLATMSHEIRTPMNAILGMSELLEMRTTNWEHREMLGVITASSQSLLRILNDVLDISKVEAGHLGLQLVAASVPDVVRAVALTFAETAKRKGLALDWSVHPAIASAHTCDPVRLRQVLLNLAGNAVKFTESGSVGIRAHLEREESGVQFIEFAVTDTGIGIAHGDQARLFQPFVQADDPGSRHRGGTGLGLAISRRLVELMNGDIDLQSDPGIGTTVRVRLALPIATLDTPGPTAVPSAELQSPAAVGDARPVLVVDDNEFNRSVLVKQVATLGYTAEQAADGEEALRRCRERDYSLILADCQMPGMDGFAFARAMRAEESARPDGLRTPIVGWTANVMPEDVEACLAAGMDAVLAKPSALATVQSALDTWV